MRIVAGKWGGRRLQAPKGRGTRPTADKVREGIFNVLAHLGALENATVWDLYAGTGALGIEALSRGAAAVTFVEAHGPTARLIRENLKILEPSPGQTQVLTTRVERWLPRATSTAPVGLVLMDPPYAIGVALPFLEALAASQALSTGALIVVETARGAGLRALPCLELLQVKVYGDTEVSFLRTSLTGTSSVLGFAGADPAESSPADSNAASSRDFPEPVDFL